MKAGYNNTPLKYIKAAHRDIAIFSTDGENIDNEVVKSFGDEWLKFHDFSEYVFQVFLITHNLLTLKDGGLKPIDVQIRIKCYFSQPI